MNIKKTTIYSILIIFFLNAFLVFAYYKFYLVGEINSNINELSLKYENDINTFLDKLENSNLNNIKNTCNEITNEYNSVLILKDYDGNVFCSNEIKETKPIYMSTRIIEISNKFYILNYYDNTNTAINSFFIIQNFILFELGLSIVVIIIAFLLTTLKIITPIQKLQKELKNYKIGIKPKKRKVRTEVDEIQNNFIELIEKLEEEKSNQNRIIASISHDIKTPLTSIMGYASRLDTASLNEETKKNYIKKIYNKSINLKEIVEEFDDYLSCNIKDTLKLETYKIDEITKALERDYKDELKEKNIDFIIESNIKRGHITIDQAKFKRIFSNIITNSVNHFNGSCGIIKIECKDLKKYYEFVISDNGGGVKEENLTNIFEPLFTTDPSRKIPGLGLAICKEIVEVHKGNIYAKNNDMGGLSIYFRIKK